SDAAHSTAPTSATITQRGDLARVRDRRRRCAAEKTSGTSTATANASSTELNGNPSNRVSAAGVANTEIHGMRKIDDRLVARIFTELRHRVSWLRRIRE